LRKTHLTYEQQEKENAESHSFCFERDFSGRDNTSFPNAGSKVPLRESFPGESVLCLSAGNQVKFEFYPEAKARADRGNVGSTAMT
jgi:hypothetical protein